MPETVFRRGLSFSTSACRRNLGEAERLMRRHLERAIEQITEGAGGSGGPLKAE